MKQASKQLSYLLIQIFTTMEFTKSNANNVSWTELFNKLQIKHEERKNARKSLRDGTAKFEPKEIQILQSSNFFKDWFQKNQSAMQNTCSTQTSAYFESIIKESNAKK